ncbi:IS110 family transposase [Anoxybacillus sp. UARK-01]|uniref:IS110 family transposase n=1 Tax=Anoxybacillus sp. UARK-01 TaxID=1895648 RepID=UPI0009BC0334|nr:IS110 family transposase [Anoxybacillus sp. UARK-01]OQM47053.1 IS110 family transposase [Anoxybacillus sp. UARK-01]
MDVLYHRCAGLDVHAKTIVVYALVGEEEHIQKEIEPFPTFTKDLFRLLKWLEDRRITHIAMESTGVYWKPVFNILEGYFDITLANAQRIKNVPGRKTDVSDAEWMAKLLRHGLIEKSFVPPADIRELQDLTRLRKKWMGQLTAEKNRIHKVLECSNIKLSAVISDIFGASGRKLLNRLMKQGYIEEWEIDACIHERMKEKKAQIQESLFGTLTEHQLFMIRQSWKHIEYLESLIQEMDHRIDQLLQTYQQELELLMTILGVKKETAAVIIAEIGVDMGQFPTSQHLASWAGVAPGNHESAGKRKSTRTTKGNPHIKSALCEAAWALSRCKNQRLAAKFWSLKSRRGTKKALVAIAHRVLIIVYCMLSRKEPFREQPTH